MSDYTEVAERVLAAIERKGATVTFHYPGTPATYNPADDSWSGGTPDSDVIGRAVQITSDPDRLRALSLILVNPLTLMIAASGLTVTPTPGQMMTWAGVAYSILNVEVMMPDGQTPIIYTVIGSA